ncbi:Orn/DAP/Arg decarboxylase 2 [Paenibacillus curdlanolyticus YK9]|uniref:Diaminopimelate decarboxylase n=1 Tax=Paenibacillus curdlanolyticus YK9 TaxID=717606 RepID=E0I5V4_9BACL|nr:diaminopimelate decarboxylase [Paenibacillus curdlanolyticus]EFM12346.1 Orn/DAP/Arg decarboxylase 2 [Paenibacillus curdlanolyticus YK9]
MTNSNQTALSDKGIQQAVERFGTPLYLYDASVVEQKVNELRSCFPEQAELFYSFKCNPLVGMAQLLLRQGCRVEVASGGELTAALHAGCDPRNIVFTSPGKTVEELQLAIRKGIYCINVENMAEIGLVDQIAAEQGLTVDIAIRINPDEPQQHAASIKMSGVPSQFGMDPTYLPEAIETAQRMSNVRLIGFHIYLGTQILQADAIIRHFDQSIRTAVDLADRFGLELQFLDIGGGFGVPYFPKETALDLASLREGIMQVWQEWESRLANTRLAIESGRFLMAESGVFVSKVLYTKESKGSRYVIGDGGSHQHASSAFLGRYIRSNFPMRVIGEGDGEHEVTVTGPLCTSTDVIGNKVNLPIAAPGDLVVVEKSGAYGLTHSPTMFLSHPMPAEVLFDQDRYWVLRERGQFSDCLHGQHPLTEEVNI